MVTIPHYSPEEMAPELARFRGDGEKVATTPLTSLEVYGVRLDSRYRKAHEFEAMAQMVEDVEPRLRRHIYSIYCNSKHTCDYLVTLNRCISTTGKSIARQIVLSCFKQHGGYNALEVVDWRDRVIFEDSGNWPDEEIAGLDGLSYE